MAGNVDEVCKICQLYDLSSHGAEEERGKRENSDLVCLRENGAGGINTAVVKRNVSLLVTAGVRVHVGCRKIFTNQHEIQRYITGSGAKKQAGSKKSERLSLKKHSPYHLCFFCDQEICVDHKCQLNGASAFQTNRVVSFASTIGKGAKLREDDWATLILGKLAFYMNGLHAFGVEYHEICTSNFRSNFRTANSTQIS